MNIKKLMDKNDVSLRKLSEQIGITHPTLTKYVEGTQPIDSEKLMSIALFFNKPFDYFFKEENNEISFMFRADKANKNIRDIDIDLLKSSINSYLDIIGEVQYQFIPQKYAINLNDDKNSILNLVSKIAYEQRRNANIENIIPENYYEVIQNLGIHVIVRDFKNDDYFGASSYSKELGSYIIINNSINIPEERKIFSLIHEYGHLLFHSEQYSSHAYNAFYPSVKSDFNEKIANHFAGSFLMPKNLVDNFIGEKKCVDPMEMKKYFKVSLQTVVFMLKYYDIINKDQSNDFWKTINMNHLKNIEPYPIEMIDIQEKNIKLIYKIKELYLSEDISANKISEVLGIDTLETRKLLQTWRNTDERCLHLK